MNDLGIVVTLVAGLLLLILPQRWAAIPLLLGVCYVTRGQEFEIGPAHMTVVRVLVFIGFVRILLRGEKLAHGWHVLDGWMMLWATILIGTSAFHTDDAWVNRAGLIWTELGSYVLFRIFLQNIDDVQATVRFMCFALLPLAVLMMLEKTTRANFFGVLGGVHPLAIIRDGNIRAGGPFDHPILAGTVAAAAIAFGIALGRRALASALAGICAGTAMLYAATSSGPILMAAFIVLGRMTWALRKHMRSVRWLVAGGLLALAAVMNDPIYYLMARIDISGGSQGYFRARLIDSAITHLSEWWAAGTDYTRHWMDSGIYANDIHTDITNHYLFMGVLGGLPLMIVFVQILRISFHDVGMALQQGANLPRDQQRFIWTLGALLFGYVMMFWSATIYDQSVVFFYLVLAAIQATVRPAQARARVQPNYWMRQA